MSFTVGNWLAGVLESCDLHWAAKLGSADPPYLGALLSLIPRKRPARAAPGEPCPGATVPGGTTVAADPSAAAQDGAVLDGAVLDGAAAAGVLAAADAPEECEAPPEEQPVTASSPATAQASRARPAPPRAGFTF